MVKLRRKKFSNKYRTNRANIQPPNVKCNCISPTRNVLDKACQMATSLFTGIDNSSENAEIITKWQTGSKIKTRRKNKRKVTKSKMGLKKGKRIGKKNLPQNLVNFVNSFCGMFSNLKSRETTIRKLKRKNKKNSADSKMNQNQSPNRKGQVMLKTTSLFQCNCIKNPYNYVNQSQQTDFKEPNIRAEKRDSFDLLDFNYQFAKNDLNPNFSQISFGVNSKFKDSKDFSYTDELKNYMEKDKAAIEVRHMRIQRTPLVRYDNQYDSCIFDSPEWILSVKEKCNLYPDNTSNYNKYRLSCIGRTPYNEKCWIPDITARQTVLDFRKRINDIEIMKRQRGSPCLYSNTSEMSTQTEGKKKKGKKKKKKSTENEDKSKSKSKSRKKSTENEDKSKSKSKSENLFESARKTSKKLISDMSKISLKENSYADDKKTSVKKTEKSQMKKSVSKTKSFGTYTV